MVRPAGRADSRGKEVVEVLESSDDSSNYHCPTCYKTFYSTQSLCAHQNAHRLVKEPMKISPVLAAVLNNPPPPFHKPFLIPPRSNSKPDLVEANRAAARELGSNKPAAAYLSPRYHPYSPNPNQLQNKFKKETTSPTTRETGGFMRQLFQNQPRHHQLAAPVEKEGCSETDPAMDLLGEWRPVTVRCYGDDGCLLGIGTSSGKKLSVPGKYSVEVVREPDDPLPDLELCLGPPGGLDLRLKLGF